MEAVVAQDFYYHYRFEVRPTPTGNIVKVWRASKFGDRSLEYVGSYFSQNRRVPRGSAYNVGPSAKYEHLRKSAQPALF